MTDPRLTRTDTHFICQICIEWFEYSDAYRDPAGQRWDVCGPCGVEDDRYRTVSLWRCLKCREEYVGTYQQACVHIDNCEPS